MEKRILYIDDGKVLSLATSELLKKRGVEVEYCDSAKDLDVKTMAEKFDLILLDIEMPEVSGIEFLKKLRLEFDKSILPVVMISALDGGESIVDALKEGANDYVTKPINIEVLDARIQTQVELQRLHKDFSRRNKIEALNAMITTYNHEINNPLTIAFGMMGKMKKDEAYDPVLFEKLSGSLERVKDIVQKIKKVTEDDEVDFDQYTKDSKMIKL